MTIKALFKDITRIYHIRQNTISCSNMRNWNTQESWSFPCT